MNGSDDFGCGVGRSPKLSDEEDGKGSDGMVGCAARRLPGGGKREKDDANVG